jgi:hypothetical protein
MTVPAWSFVHLETLYLLLKLTGIKRSKRRFGPKISGSVALFFQYLSFALRQRRLHPQLPVRKNKDALTSIDL